MQPSRSANLRSRNEKIRSHAQKYFLKVQKNGTNEHLPPPRPKRKAAHPYPQKAPKAAQVQSSGSSCALLEPGDMEQPGSTTMLKSHEGNTVMSSWTSTDVQRSSLFHDAKGKIETQCPVYFDILFKCPTPRVQ